MHPWEHDHTFQQDQKKPGEVRTLMVALLTAGTMVLEIAAGVIYGSMALLADGLHMASHATALAIALAAYVYARHNARDARFSFGTGKINSLAGFSGAILLAVFSLLMVWESIERLVMPVPIAFNQALLVAVAGLLVNGFSVLILGGDNGPVNEREHDYEHEHEHEHEHERERGHGYAVAGHHHHDHNLRSAYLHVLADALTSLLAIGALLAGKYLGWNWLDPTMGILGALLVARWSIGLSRATSHMLLDRQGPESLCDAIRTAIEREGDAVADLHLWAIAPGMYGLILSVVSDHPRSPSAYRQALPSIPGLAHVTIEAWPRQQSAHSARQ